MVFQDNFLFSGTIKENIMMGNPEATIDELMSAIRAAHLEDMIAELPDGLDTELGERGLTLSGGQRQALTLLMATLKKPKVLLLDEHTAALDPKTAKKVLDITESIVEKDKLTTIMITHNMADAIRVGNRLIMMHEGQIVVDVKGEEKKNLTIEQLLQLFEQSSGSQFTSDKVMLSK